MNPKYHIDVTPEEDRLFRDIEQTPIKKPKSIKIIIGVVAAHILVIGAIATTVTARALEINKHNLQLQQDSTFVSNPDPNKIIPTSEPKIQPTPQETPQTASTANQTTSPKLTKSYTVKKGDTLYGISKKFKLNFNTLLKINNIKDPTKVYIGQELKFIND